MKSISLTTVIIFVLVFSFSPLFQTTEDRIKFWFATGGAGFCISRPLALKMAPVIRNEKLITISDRIRFPDDVSIGFIIGKLSIHRCLIYGSLITGIFYLEKNKQFCPHYRIPFASAANCCRRIPFTFGIAWSNSFSFI